MLQLLQLVQLILLQTLSITLGTTTASVGTDTSDNGGTVDETLAITADNEETLSILSQGGANFVKLLTAADATSLTISGNKALTIASIASATGLATINASAATANVVISANASTTASTITGGTGNDTFVGSSKADSIDGGAGNDSLTGGSGADTIIGGTGDDTIIGFGVDSLAAVTPTFNATALPSKAMKLFRWFRLYVGIHKCKADRLNWRDFAIKKKRRRYSYTMTLTDAVYTANGKAMTLMDALTSGTPTLTASALTAANAVVVDLWRWYKHQHNTTGINDKVIDNEDLY